MNNILEFIAIFAVGVLPHLVSTIRFWHDPDISKRNTAFQQLTGRWWQAVSTIAVVVYAFSNLPALFTDLGIYLGQYDLNRNAFSVGVISTAGLVFAPALIRFLVRRIQHKDISQIQVVMNEAIREELVYKTPWQRITRLVVLVFGVLAEDLVYRAYLVWVWGNRTHNFVPWIIFSLTLSVIVHLYQGRTWKNVLIHSGYAAFFIGLMIYTGNIVAVVTAHLYINVLGAASIWRIKELQALQPAAPVHSKLSKLAYAAFIGGNLLVLLFISIVLS